MPIELQNTRYLGIEFAQLPLEALASQLMKLISEDHFSFIVTPNVDHVVQMYQGEDAAIAVAFNNACHAATLRVCDSRVLQLLAKVQGTELVVVPGSDLTAFLFARGLFNGLRIGLVGGGDQTVARLNARYPDVSMIQFQPPMGLLRSEAAMQAVVTFVRETRCDFVLFAVGSPQSEIIAHMCLEDGHAKGVGLCIGASIEFIAGEKKRAPRWMQVARLEWAFRLLSEPRRLWRRYLVVGPQIIQIIREKHK